MNPPKFRGVSSASSCCSSWGGLGRGIHVGSPHGREPSSAVVVLPAHITLQGNKRLWCVPNSSTDKYLQAGACSARFCHPCSIHRLLAGNTSLLRALLHLCPCPPRRLVPAVTVLWMQHFAFQCLLPGATRASWGACSPSPPNKCILAPPLFVSLSIPVCNKPTLLDPQLSEGRISLSCGVQTRGLAPGCHTFV